MKLDMQNLTKELFEKLVSTESTIAFAESCTGGLLSAEITKLAGISSYFMGSVVSYTGAVKANVLEVPVAVLEEKGEVSVETALAMATGAKKVLGSSWALSITGIAGPDGGTEDTPVGTVCFALVGPNFELVKKEIFNYSERDTGREQIQQASVAFALKMMIENLK